jgi:multiple sugar transport system permease protein
METTVLPTAVPRRIGISKSRRAEARFAYLLLLPALLLVFVFRILPLGWGFLISLTDATGVTSGHFIGTDNYMEAAGDPNFIASIRNTVFVLVTLPVWVMLPMLLAILIHQGVPGGRFFRAVYFFPVVLSSVIVGAIFNVVLRYDGSFNALLKLVGIAGVDWLGSSATALPSLLAVQFWSTFGMGVLIFLAGMSTVNQDLIDAAKLDGAKMRQIWVHVIIPALWPIIEFSAVVTTIGVLTSMFGLIYVLTAGGPGTATTLPEFLIWLEQGKINRPGYAAALSMILFAMMAGLAWAQIRIMSRNTNL